MTKLALKLLVLAVFMSLAGCSAKVDSGDYRGIPHLPRPIAAERALVTTAGQGLEGLIVAKYANKLNIPNYYRHRAEAVDLQDVNSLIITLGFSANGMESAYTDPEKEKERLEALVAEAAKDKKPVILMHIGGMERRSPLNDRTAEWLMETADYLIVVRDGNKDGFFSQLARTKKVPFTAVGTLEQIKVPLNSAYR